MLGFGTETIGTDAGQALHLQPPYPCHYYMHGSGRYGLQCLTNLDLLPPTGAVMFCPPLKIRQGPEARCACSRWSRPVARARHRRTSRRTQVARRCRQEHRRPKRASDPVASDPA